MTNEFVVPQSTAKFTKHARDSLAVGALARFNLNAEKLLPLAAAVAADLGLVAPCTNPFMNTIAQLVECVHSVEDSIAIINTLLERGLQDEPLPKITPRAGRGIGGVEVPRGVLFHDYTYDDNGTCTAANCIIPTNQNHNNIQKDFDAIVPQVVGTKSAAEIQLMLEMLVRAYDPCISCSTH